jgi:CHAT domain-containing protein
MLHLLPFEALPWNDGFLGQSIAVVYLPAASMIARAGDRPSRGHVVVVSAADGGAARGLAPLRHASREARAVATAHPVEWTTWLTGDEATLEGLSRAAREPFGVLHVTAHAVLDPETGPRILLAPGPDGAPGILDLSSLNRLPASPALAVLSACETGRGELVGGEGVLGLVRALTLAGTRQVVASLWTVDDERSTRLMAAFHRALGQGLAPSRALQAARREMLADGFVHPFYWSGFVLYGSDSVPAQ